MSELTLGCDPSIRFSCSTEVLDRNESGSSESTINSKEMRKCPHRPRYPKVRADRWRELAPSSLLLTP